VELEKSHSHGFCEFLEIRGSVYVVTENAEYSRALLEFLPGDGLLSFHVRLAGSLSIAASRTTTLQVVSPTLLVWHQPVGVDANEWWTPGTRGLSVTIYSRPEFVRSVLAKSNMASTHQIEQFLVDSSPRINYCQLPVNSEILVAAQGLASPPYDGRLRLIHMEAKALELYCLILSAFDRLSDPVIEYYSEADRKRLYRAREILSSRFNPVPTIRSMAHEIGINETKLKNGFKTLFGKTVFEYGQLCRMEYAMQLLRNQRLPIGLVAEAVGYSHQTSFASAFKQHFGYRPREVRNVPSATSPASETMRRTLPAKKKT
jgi:AraC-like DNA-binding protein